MKKEKLLTGLLTLCTGLLVVGLIVLGGCKKDEVITTVTATTAAITDISTTTATGGGTVAIVGAGSVTERGVCWSENHNPTTGGSKTVDGSGIGTFTSSLTGLFNSTTYFVRAYAVLNGKTTYGDEVSFTTSAPIEKISNGDFSTPDGSVTAINSTTPWKTDGVDDGSVIGRGPATSGGTDFMVWQSQWAKSFYQVSGTVPSAETAYKIGLSGWYDYSYWHPGYDATVAVRFSAYSGSDPTTRVKIDSVVFVFDGQGGTADTYGKWTAKTADYTLSAAKATQFAGKNLVIEFDVLDAFQASGYTGYDDADVWFWLDNLSVKQQ